MSFDRETIVHSLDHKGADIPDTLGYPMHYIPHELAKRAAEDLQEYLRHEGQELHDFYSPRTSEGGGGKMMGVLVVRTATGGLGYLAGFSGALGGKTVIPGFVPPIFDLLDKESFFGVEEAKITEVNHRHAALEEQLTPLKKKLDELTSERNEEVDSTKRTLKKNKQDRDSIRQTEPDQETIERLDWESANENIAFKRRKALWRDTIEEAEREVNEITEQIKELEKKRAEMSQLLQVKLFDAYVIQNANGDRITLTQLFRDKRGTLPPAAAGDCAAPKLFHYALENDLTPIALCEFWWGIAAKNRVRKEGVYYPACKFKCEPILNFMLKGLPVEENPLTEVEELPNIPTLYEDEHILAINKPSGFLSVPGNTDRLSVIDWLRARYPHLDEATNAHRLDMDTSGILLIAKSAEVLKLLHRQFTNRKVEKEYVALLDGQLDQKEGVISLPLRPDIEDRPRQMVCEEHGKPAETRFKILGIEDGKTRILFNPITGRTHQLRVHASHPRGLNMAIEGDNLYGMAGERLKLHAAKLVFKHPITGREVTIKCEPSFT